jgi:hypothetical protein
MASSIAFWSYVRDDDNAELGRISQLSRDVVSQYELLAGGDTLEMFLDTESIQLGEDWRKIIQERLSSANFFIPVITPRYFRSTACVDELKEFSLGAKRLGVKELIIPILYADVPGFDDENPDNELIKLIKSFQYQDWREIRFEEVNTKFYRQGVYDIALRIFSVNNQGLVDKPLKEEIRDSKTTDDEDVPGTIEILAEYEKQIELLPQTLETISENITKIGGIMRESTENIHRADEQGKGFAARLANINRVADLMNEPTEEIWTSCNLYASQIDTVDQAFRIIIEQSAHEIENNPDSKSEVCNNFRTILRLSTAAQGAIINTNGMIDALEPLEKLSRNIKPVVRKLKNGLVLLVNSTNVTDYWIKLIEETGIDCDEDYSNIPSN